MTIRSTLLTAGALTICACLVVALSLAYVLRDVDSEDLV